MLTRSHKRLWAGGLRLAVAGRLLAIKDRIAEYGP